MSIAYVPEQSFTGAAVPLELTARVRLIGGAAHRNPPWNAAAHRPLVPYTSTPGLLLRDWVQPTVKPFPSLALAVPAEPIVGTQPSEFVFAVQYTSGGITEYSSSPIQVPQMFVPWAYS
jgi:hypothetical protein